MLLFEYDLALYEHVVTLDGNHLAGVLVNEVFDPALQNTGRQLPAYDFLQIGFVDLNLVRQVEDSQYHAVALEADGTQQSGDGQLLLTVDVGVHHVVDVGGELYPRTLERYDTGRIELSAVGVYALTEEHAGRTVQLRDDDTLGAVYNERTARSHIGHHAEIHILHHRVEIFVLRVGAIQFQLRLEGHAVCEAALQTLLYRVAGRIDIVVDEFEDEVIAGIGDREILQKDLVQPLVQTILGRRIKLKEIME